MVKRKRPETLSYAPLTAAILELADAVRSSETLPTYHRKRALNFLAGLDKIIKAHCDAPPGETDYVIGPQK